MLKKIISKRNSVLCSWLISYFLILLVPIIVGGVIYVSTKQNTKEVTYEVNNLLLQQMKYELDSYLDDVANMDWSVSIQPIFQTIIKENKDKTGEIYYMASEISSNLKQWKAINTDMNEIYLYFRDVDLVISSEGIYTSKKYYDINFGINDISYDDWINKLMMSSKGQLIELPYGGQGTSGIAYIKRMSELVGANSPIAMVALIDKDRFAKQVKDMKLLNKGNVYIVDSFNNRIILHGTNKDEEYFTYNEITQLEKTDRITRNKNNDIILIANSNVSSVRYIVTISESAFFESNRFVTRITLFGGLVAILLGLYMIYMAFMKNYSPLNNMINKLKENSEISGNNEYGIIENAIDGIVKRQNNIMRNMILNKLLKGMKQYYNELETEKSLYDIDLNSKLFSVILFYLEDDTELYGDMTISSEKRWELDGFVLTNMMIELLNEQSFKAYMTEIDSMIAFVVGYDEEQSHNGLEQITNKVLDIAKMQLGLKFSASISSAHCGTEGICKCYSECQQTMDYKLIMTESKTIVYMPSSNAHKYNYSLEKEQQFISAVKRGDVVEARYVVDKIISDMLDEGQRSLALFKCFIMDLCATLIKTSEELSINGDDHALNKELLIIGRIQASQSMTEITEEIYGYINMVCDGLRDGKQENFRLVDDVLHYIKNNYSDPDLNVASLNQKFGISSVYLSKMFKSTTGEGILEYINRVRIEKAMELFRTTHLSVDEVSDKVGFSNRITFYRLFKKHTATSPTGYKESSTRIYNSSNEDVRKS